MHRRREFLRWVAASGLLVHDTNTLVGLWDGPDGRLAHPSPDHWIPLLYAYAATDEKDRVRCPVEGFDGGSLSMRNIVFG